MIATAITTPAIAHALMHVFDPELGIDLVSLGLVYAIDHEPGAINVQMATTSAMCPMGEAMLDDAARMLSHRFPGAGVNVDLVTEPAWDIRMATPEALAWLGVGRDE